MMQDKEDRADAMADEYCGGHHDDLTRAEQIRWTTYRNGVLAALSASPLTSREEMEDALLAEIKRQDGFIMDVRGLADAVFALVTPEG